MITFLDLLFGLASSVLEQYGKKLPAELVSATQAAVDAWATHRSDVVTKAALEAERG